MLNRQYTFFHHFYRALLNLSRLNFKPALVSNCFSCVNITLYMQIDRILFKIHFVLQSMGCFDVAVHMKA